MEAERHIDWKVDATLLIQLPPLMGLAHAALRAVRGEKPLMWEAMN